MKVWCVFLDEEGEGVYLLSQVLDSQEKANDWVTKESCGLDHLIEGWDVT